MKTIKCKNPDCPETRMLNPKKGTYFTYCEKHQRQYWREASKPKRPVNPPLIDSIGDNGTAVEAAHAAMVAKTSRLSDEDKQRLIAESRARVQARKTDSSTHQLDALNEGRITIDELDAALHKLPRIFEERIPASEVAAPSPTDVDHRFKDTYTDEDLQKIGEVLKAQPHPFLSPVTYTKYEARVGECASGCDDCLYRDVVELLEKNMPGLRGLVDGLKTIRGQK